MAKRRPCAVLGCRVADLTADPTRHRHGVSPYGFVPLQTKRAPDEWQNDDLQKTLATDAADIFNFVESMLFYCLLLNKTVALQDKKCTRGKRAKNCIVSVAFGINMTGSEKLPPMFIRSYGNPRCFKGAHLSSGVVCKSNRKACMTAQLFKEYVHQQDHRFATQQRNILTVLENVSAHVVLDTLTAIKLLFLPPNMTALTQPLNHGIIRFALPMTVQNSCTQAKFTVRDGDDDDIDEAIDKYESPLAEVPERQELSDRDIVAAAAPRTASSKSEDDTTQKWMTALYYRKRRML
ncbi:hypothetical protein HPB50_022103 [Hyalomma asiaticum]|uniref:Uncharacterized protein n=1 Tax=Hyalomma asiaticum TaxID=266040 RepID=A0ACB7TK34_HYAAI|nr:hypothetical protein HPB50_022103 [Hyalomma asiaticum]